MNEFDHLLTESCKMFRALEESNPNSVIDRMESVEDMAQEFWESRYLFGLVNYNAGDFESALQNFTQSLNRQPYDELSQFYLGNCYIRFRKFKEAKICFKNAVKVRNSFKEAVNNLAITAQSIMQGYVKKSDWENLYWNVSSSLNFDVENSEACLDIPIFINNRDRVGCLSKLIDWLLESGYRRIYILDQDSTYPPLLEFYEIFRKDPRVHVLRMKNFGFQCIWQSGILEDLDVQTPYVYTDSDILPICGKNIVQELLKTLARHPFAKKVGAKLIFEDITCQNADFYREIQSNYYQESRRISPNEFFMPNDTTFSVYRNLRHYSCIYSIVRTDLEIRHLPWYYDFNNLPEDEKYYVEHSNSNSTFSKQLKSHSSSSLNL